MKKIIVLTLIAFFAAPAVLASDGVHCKLSQYVKSGNDEVQKPVSQAVKKKPVKASLGS